MRLLLICPRFPESFWSAKWAIEEILPDKYATNSPLGLATLAALCPAHWEVEIIDENVEALPTYPDADIVGVCGMEVQFERQKEIIEYYHGLGFYVVAGGSYASLCPESFEEIADCVISGEAEYIFPEFCRDIENGIVKKLYREDGNVDMRDSPTPRFDLLKLHRYNKVSLQFSRGCPFRCEFCDIIVMFGRKPRTKDFEQVGRELDALRRLGVRDVFFVDDNLIGNLPLAKGLLRYLIQYQTHHDYWFNFGTEASLNMAQHPELLRLFREANFGWVFIGIETTDPDSLVETQKVQNLHEDILESVRRIYGYGIEVLAGFIVGFDHDTVESFDRQYRFIVRSGIQAAMIGLLVAMPKTPLYERLKRDGRLNVEGDVSDMTRAYTNVIPKCMSYQELVSGYVKLYRSLLQDRSIAMQVNFKLRYLKAPVYKTGYSSFASLMILLRFICRGILPGGPRRIWYFVSTLPFTRPVFFSTVVSDWITALSMGDFASRKLTLENAQQVPHNAVATLAD